MRVRVEWRREHGSRGADFEQLAAEQHAYAIRDRPYHGKVVGNEQHGKVVLGAQALEQLQDAGLHRDVQSGQDFVAQQEAGVAGQGAGNRDALPLAARELVRVALGVARIQAHVLEQRRDPLLRLGRRIWEKTSSGRPTVSPTVRRGLSEASGFWKMY